MNNTALNAHPPDPAVHSLALSQVQRPPHPKPFLSERARVFAAHMRIGIVASVLLALPGCGNGGDAFAPPACTAPVDLLIGAGTAPSFEWAGCRAAGLGVEALDGSGQVMWSVLTVGVQNTLQSPVRYGQRPASPPVFADPAQPLTAGTRYLATLYTGTSGPSGPNPTEIARQEFVP